MSTNEKELAEKLSPTDIPKKHNKQRKGLIIEILVNFVLPWLVYSYFIKSHWSPRDALLASAVPPIIWSILELVRYRRLDALSIIIVAGILLSIIAVSLGGSTLLILMRESLITALFGAVFLVSAMFKKPIIYYLARATVIREGGDMLSRFEEKCRTPEGKIANWMVIMSIVWGIGLLAEAGLKLFLAKSLATEQFLLISPWISYGIYGLFGGWTWWYRKKIRATSSNRQ